MMMERLIALLILSPFALFALAAWRFYRANPDARPRQPRDYVRETWKRREDRP